MLHLWSLLFRHLKMLNQTQWANYKMLSRKGLRQMYINVANVDTAV